MDTEDLFFQNVIHFVALALVLLVPGLLCDIRIPPSDHGARTIQRGFWPPLHGEFMERRPGPDSQRRIIIKEVRHQDR